MNRMKKWLTALLVVIAPPILLFLSNWGYSVLNIYLKLQNINDYAIHNKPYAAGLEWLYWSAVCTALGVLFGFLTTRFVKKEDRRWGILSYTGGLLLTAAFGVIYALFRQGSIGFPTWIHNIFVMFDLRGLYLWVGVYLVQIIRRTHAGGGKVQLKPAGEGSAALPSGSSGNTAAMLCVILLPALLLAVSAYALSTFAAQMQQTYSSGAPYWNIVFYTITGGLFGAVPWLCGAEKKRLRCAVAVTFGLAGVLLLGMLQSILSSVATSPLAFLTHLNVKEVFFWTGLYLYLMASLLRQGYRERNMGGEA